MNLKFYGWDYLGLILLSAIAFLPFLGTTPLFDWDEINFAESAREMLVSGNYWEVQINYAPFHEKPPLFFWMQAFCMYVFGVGEWAARLPNVIAGLLSLILLFHLGVWLKDRVLGWIFVCLCVASLLPHFYFRTGIIDPWFNLFILTGILAYARYFHGSKNIVYALLSGACIGLAVLTKGPVALLMSGLCLGLYAVLYVGSLSRKFFFPFLFACTLPLLVWYGSITWLKGSDFILYFLNYQIELFTQPVAGHEQAWYYHFLVVLLACFPASIFLFRAHMYHPVDYRMLSVQRLCLILFWLVLIIFSISKTKIIHYSSLAWLPAVILSGIWIHRRCQLKQGANVPEYIWGLCLTGIIPGVLIFVLGLVDISTLRGLLSKDIFMQAALSTPLEWPGLVFLSGAWLALGSTLLMVLYFRNLNWLYLTGAHMLHTIVFLHLIAGIVAPKIAEIVQGSAVRFYTSLQNEKVVVITEGFKSYAHYFYARVEMPDRPELQNKEWLIYGEIDRPVWMVIRVDRLNENVLQVYSNFREEFRAGGFVFFVRMP